MSHINRRFILDISLLLTSAFAIVYIYNANQCAPYGTIVEGGIPQKTENSSIVSDVNISEKPKKPFTHPAIDQYEP
jgi:hypothetical protein